MACSSNYPPFTVRRGFGPMSGALVDSLELIAPSAGIFFDYRDVPWARAQQMLRSGQLDGTCTVATDERRQYLDFAPTPVFAEPTVIVYRSEDDRFEAVESLDDLRGLRFGEPLGSGWIKETLKHQSVIWTADADNLLDMIVAGRIDASFLGLWTVRVHLAASTRREGLCYRVLPFAPRDEFRFGLRKSYPGAAGLLAAVDTAIAAAQADGAIDRIVETYTHAPG
jgi:polar amino acid transport system substrate-binding protein